MVEKFKKLWKISVKNNSKHEKNNKKKQWKLPWENERRGDFLALQWFSWKFYNGTEGDTSEKKKHQNIAIHEDPYSCL